MKQNWNDTVFGTQELTEENADSIAKDDSRAANIKNSGEHWRHDNDGGRGEQYYVPHRGYSATKDATFFGVTKP